MTTYDHVHYVTCSHGCFGAGTVAHGPRELESLIAECPTLDMTPIAFAVSPPAGFQWYRDWNGISAHVYVAHDPAGVLLWSCIPPGGEGNEDGLAPSYMLTVDRGGSLDVLYDGPDYAASLLAMLDR